MKRRVVSSSNIASIGWEEGPGGTGDLEVEYKSGHVYVYHDVPEGVYRTALGASSVGKFVASSIQDVFEHTRVS
jgi:hypothetical protein